MEVQGVENRATGQTEFPGKAPAFPDVFSNSSIAPAPAVKGIPYKEMRGDIDQIQEHLEDEEWEEAENLCKKWLQKVDTKESMATFYNFLLQALNGQEKYQEAEQNGILALRLDAGAPFLRQEIAQQLAIAVAHLAQIEVL